jgi:hypothetical protein
VVTGVGLVCALGIGTEPVWQKLVCGESGVGPVTQFMPPVLTVASPPKSKVSIPSFGSPKKN